MTVAAGFFDGVHLGHQAVLRGADAALTFANHPRHVLCPDAPPRLLMATEDRLAAIRACGVARVEALPFTAALAAEEPEEFLARCALLAPEGGVLPTVRCGASWRFGRGGRGTPELLREKGYPVMIVESVAVDGENVSSTRIREALAAGDVALAARLLGRHWRVRGAVRAGKGLGRTLGFPTLNLELATEPGLFPELRYGVYVVEVDGVPALANWGVAPTMRERAWPTPVLEAHFPGGRVPAGELLAVKILRFLREERAFASVDALRAQIRADLDEVKMV